VYKNPNRRVLALVGLLRGGRVNKPETTEHEHFSSPHEAGARLNWSATTVRRYFRGKPGVVELSFPSPLASRKRSPRTLMRIPESVLVREIQKLSAGNGIGLVKSNRRG
jgi:hypothetical protein